MPVLRPVRRLITQQIVVAAAAPAADIEFDNATLGGFQTANGQTYAHTIGGGDDRLLIVVTSGEYSTAGTGSTVSGITYNGVALTKALHAAEESEVAKIRVELWYLLEADLPAAGSYNVVVTMAGTEFGANGYGSAVASYANVEQGPPEAIEDNNSATDTTTFSTNIDTLTDGAWVFDVIAGGANNAITADGGQDERTDQGGAPSGQRQGHSTKLVATAGTTTLGWATGGAAMNRWAHALAVWAPAGS